MSVLDRIIGKPLATEDEEEHKIRTLAGIPVLGLDGLSSSAYGPEAALTILLPLGVLGLNYIGPIILVILVLLAILYFSYRQTIAAYPEGGGSYTVASENLGIRAGLLAAAALLLDYILNVAVGISAGIGALVSALPSLHDHTLALCLIALALITIVNLRGVRESSVAFGVPTYLFLACLFTVLAIGIVKTVIANGHPVPVVAPPQLPAGVEVASVWLLLRAFASGCTAMTGVEAVSNGVSAFAQPSVHYARRTLTAIVALLGLLLAGIAFLSRVYAIGAMDQETSGYQSVISQLVTAVVGTGVFYYVTIASVLAVLVLSANTSFAGFPRLCRLMAQDSFLPHAFADQGRRLVYSLGILILAVLSAVILIIFGGITDRLIPLFALGAFGAFALSQAGMVVFWRRKGGPGARASLLVNGLGAIVTTVAFVVILLAKFLEGAWITLVLIPALLQLFIRVRRYYKYVARRTRCSQPLDVSDTEPPIVVVPIASWSVMAEKALRFGLKLSPDVTAVNIRFVEEMSEALQSDWETCVEEPMRRAGRPVPRLELIYSPYRQVMKPLLDLITRLEEEHPTRSITVIVPELVGTHWFQYLLHNQRATTLKAALLLRGDQRVVVTNAPWYLSD